MTVTITQRKTVGLVKFFSLANNSFRNEPWSAFVHN
jgi:hypothetical protein